MLFAHGVGSRGDLPLPLWMFTWASAIALMVSFVALGVLWTRPRLAQAAAGRVIVSHRPFVAAPGVTTTGGTPAPAGGATTTVTVEAAGPPTAGTAPAVLRAVQGVGRGAALALYLICLWAGLFGANDTSDNLLPVTLYVTVWVGAQLMAGLVGDLWGAVSPTTTLARGAEALAARFGRTPVEPPSWLGQWPAAAALYVFLFYELAHPSGAAPRTLGWMLAVHTLVVLALGARFGSRWVADHEPFNALMAWIGQMGVLFRRPDGLAVRAPMAGLARMPVMTGTLAALLIVLGGTTYDGFSESELGREILGRPSGWGGAFTEGVGLALSMAAIAALYGLGVWWTSRVTTMSSGRAASVFAPSLVPIVFGYAIAHYAQLLVDEVQSFVFRLSDPAGLGWDLFGGSDGQINFNIVSPDLVAWVQVLAILFGHIGAVIVAHDRSIELFEPGESLRSQFAMLLVMVAYSTLGLWLLLNA